MAIQTAAFINPEEDIYQYTFDEKTGMGEYNSIRVQVRPEFPEIAVAVDSDPRVTALLWQQIELLQNTSSGKTLLAWMGKVSPMPLSPGHPANSKDREAFLYADPKGDSLSDISYVYKKREFGPGQPEIPEGVSYCTILSGSRLGGSASIINIDVSYIGTTTWGVASSPGPMPKDITLFHESAHALHGTLGVLMTEKVQVAERQNGRWGFSVTPLEELVTSGVFDKGNVAVIYNKNGEIFDPEPGGLTEEFRRGNLTLAFPGAAETDPNSITGLRDAVYQKANTEDRLYAQKHKIGREFVKPREEARKATIGLDESDYALESISTYRTNYNGSSDSFAIKVLSPTQDSLKSAAEYWRLRQIQDVPQAADQALRRELGRLGRIQLQPTGPDPAAAEFRRLSKIQDCGIAWQDLCAAPVRKADPDETADLDGLWARRHAAELSSCTTCQQEYSEGSFAERYAAQHPRTARRANDVLGQAKNYLAAGEFYSEKLDELIGYRMGLLAKQADAAIAELRNAGVEFTPESENALKLQMGARTNPDRGIDVRGTVPLMDPADVARAKAEAERINSPEALQAIGLKPGEKLDPKNPADLKRLKTAAIRGVNKIWGYLNRPASQLAWVALACVLTVGQTVQTFQNQNSDSLDKARSATGCVPVVGDAIAITGDIKHGNWDDVALSSTTLLLYLAGLVCPECGVAAVAVATFHAIWDASTESLLECRIGTHGNPTEADKANLTILRLFSTSEEKRSCYWSKLGEKVKQSWDGLIKGIEAINDTPLACLLENPDGCFKSANYLGNIVAVKILGSPAASSHLPASLHGSGTKGSSNLLAY
ncbi:hypothetical protein [Streptomyces sp. NPDC057686]|uniref:hypothetical protein n=1 Tax=Streptomyces sp. NPDC057686 TaxID=3346212 RepID=UPI003691A49A